MPGRVGVAGDWRDYWRAVSNGAPRIRDGTKVGEGRLPRAQLQPARGAAGFNNLAIPILHLPGRKNNARAMEEMSRHHVFSVATA